MGSHPINLSIRFLLELSALISVGMWGWHQGEGLLRYVFAITLLSTYTIIWGVFAVPNDPSRSGNAPVPTRGVIRLLIELVLFAFAAWSLSDMGYQKSSLALGMVVLLHYLFSLDRIKWLLSR